MATSALDLLIALDARVDDLEATSMAPGSVPRVRQEWGALARASLQLLHAGPRHPNDTARRLEALLGSMAAIPGEYPLPEPGTGLMGITATIGCTAEVVRTPTIASPTTRHQAGIAIRASLEAALGRAARWTQRGFHSDGSAPDPQIVRLAGIDAEPDRSPALHAWRLIGPADPGIDGAVSRWVAAATEVIDSPRTVTQLALQLASADIALLCASTSAVMQRATQAGAFPHTTAAVAALDTAGRSWRQAARWPGELRLGGRAIDLRHASADLRRCLDDSLRTGNEWKPPSGLFVDTSPEHLVAVLHSGLQSATRLGQRVMSATDELARGASRVWVDAGGIPSPLRSVPIRSDNLRLDWWPDPADSHSGELLHEQTSRALTGLVYATPLVIEPLTSRTSLPGRVDDKGLWEAVSPPPTRFEPPGSGRAWRRSRPQGRPRTPSAGDSGRRGTGSNARAHA